MDAKAAILMSPARSNIDLLDHGVGLGQKHRVCLEEGPQGSGSLSTSREVLSFRIFLSKAVLAFNRTQKQKSRRPSGRTGG